MTELTIDELLAENPINEVPEPRLYSRANGGEVVPGAATPLTADFYRATSGASMCAMFYALGAFTAAERGAALDGSDSPHTGRFAQFLFGRLSADFDFALDVLGRVPGVDPAAIEEQLTGTPSQRLRPERSLGQTVRAGSRIAMLAMTLKRRVDRYSTTETRWWRGTTATVAHADLEEARRTWSEAVGHMRHGQALQCMVAAMHPAAVEPVMRMVRRTSADVDASDVVSGAETLEATVLRRLMDVSHGRVALTSFLDEFGFYGPGAGELSSLSWRQDPGGLDVVTANFERLGADRSPVALMQAQHRRSADARRRLLEATPAVQRPLVKALITRADHQTALRERGKTLMLMGADVARAAAVRVGEHLADAGTLDDALDVFYMTAAELLGTRSGEPLQRQVTHRRRLRIAYERLEIPINFHGSELHVLVRADMERRGDEHADSSPAPSVLTGEGVSGGRYQGVARVIRNPGSEDFEPGDVLVCVSTDPGWAPLMSLAGAIVLDLGSMLSHGAIVARELGIPCVANTSSATNTILDGSIVTVDGSTGVVELQPSP